MKRNLTTAILAVTLAAGVLTGCGATVVSTSEAGATAEPAATNPPACCTEEGATGESAVNLKEPEIADNVEYKWHVTIPGMNGSLCNIPTFIAYEKGFFAEEGLDVTLVSADYETKKVGLNNGTMPVVNGDFMYFPSIESGLNITVVDGMHKGCIKLQVLPDSDLQTVEDLRGATIAVDEIGGTPYQVAALWLEQNGIKAIGDGAEVTFLPYGDDPMALAALSKKEVTVAAVWDPMASIAESNGEVRTLLDISADKPFSDHYCCFLYASTKVLEEDPEQIAAIVRAYRKAEDYIANNPEEATNLIIETNYVSIDDHDLAVDLVKSYGYPSADDYANAKTLDAKADVLYFATALNEAGFLTEDPDTYAAKAFTEVDLGE